MITEKRLVLIASEEVIDEITYEAIELITNVVNIKDVWRRNKTPLIKKGTDASILAKEMYETLELPEFIFGPEDFITFCHKNGFECGEYYSGQKFDTSKERCFLCGIADHMGIKGPGYIYNKEVARDSEMIIYESKNFFVKIELGCLKPGMLMINPKEHILSAATIPEENMAEYENVMKDVEFLLKAIYGDKTVLFFEHGSAPDGISSHQRSIVHAHTHVVWGIKFPQKYIDMVCLKPSALKELKGYKYLSYQEGTKGQLLAVKDPNVYVQRQYPRQVIGLLEGIPNELCNWRKESFDGNIKQTYDDFYGYLNANQRFLSTRIIKATECFVKGYPLRNK